MSTPSNNTEVTVVVPSYNHARFVGAALRSVFGQTHAPAQLIVFDDGSDDGSPRVIEDTLSDCPFPCEFVVTRNRGLCATLNDGLARSTGRYFAYLSSDDLWLPDFLAARVRLLDSRPRAVLAYGHCFLIDEESRVVDCTRDWAAYADGDARAMLRTTIAPMSPTVVHRRDALVRHGWREGARLEDYELYLRLAADGEFAFDAAVLSAWRRHRANTSRDQLMMLEEHLEAQRRVLPAQGMSAAEMEKLRARVRFTRAEDFLRLGDKRTALRLIGRNLSGVTSARALARTALRLLVPNALMNRRKSRAERRAAERYGTISV